MIISAIEYAKIRNKSAAWVSDLIAQGMPVNSAGGSGKNYKIDLGAAIDWEIEKAKRTSGEGSSTERLRNAQAIRAEFENRARRGEFISVELFGETLNAVVGEVAGQMSGFPGRVAGKIVGIQDQAILRSTLMDECNRVRSAVANHIRDIAAIGNKASN